MQKRGDILQVIARIFSFIVILSILTVSASASDSIGWYCKRTTDHSQPILDSYLSQVDKYKDLIWIDKNHSSFEDEEKVIYLTFDAGYENGNIEKILDVLKEENVKATFFILDNLIFSNKELVGRMIDEGHLIGNHTCKHTDMSKVADIEIFRRELSSLETLFEETYGVSMPKYYRPPEGKFSLDNLRWAEELGYKTVMWSFAYADWDNNNQMDESKALDKILTNLHNGEIMLLHPTSLTNAKIMKKLICELKNQGYKFGTVDEICN